MQPKSVEGRILAPVPAARQPKVTLRGVSKLYEAKNRTTLAIDDINLEIQDGEFMAFLGPSGCGKSSLLRILAGLYEQSSGEVQVNRTHPDKPLNAMVFQEYALFPWRTVLDNVAFGLENRGVGKKERTEIALHYLAKVGLSDFAHAYPHQLSGGMKQRTSIARAFASDPEILLMDEPLGALDAQTRYLLQEELMRIWEESRKTVVYVTHSIDEAVVMGDRIVLFSARPGRIKEIYKVPLERPRHLEMNRDPRALKLHEEIWHSLREEVQLTMQQEGRKSR